VLTPEIVLASLRTIAGPDGATALADTGAVSRIVVRDGGHVVFSLAIDARRVEEWTRVRSAAEAAVLALPGVTKVSLTLTSERDAANTANAPPAKPPRAESPVSAAHATRSPFPKLAGLANVKHVIAVASGKGGVGKSTTACNVALSLSLMGLKVGVLDADIYGPSMPRLFALKGSPQIVSGRTLRPLEAYGCKVMSIGFVVDADKAMVWRGPMVASAITQMLRDVAWGPLDVLVVDMPPGTGDAQLTMAQQTPLSGAIIVSTPQDLALIDARRGVSMFKDVGVPILGLVENMSYFICDGCGKRHEIFAHGGARAEATKLGVPFLGQIPLDAAIRETSDAGLPIVVTDPDSPNAAAYKQIANSVWTSLKKM
jgi:ATP-binding protein involved in chromosome partitioning